MEYTEIEVVKDNLYVGNRPLQKGDKVHVTKIGEDAAARWVETGRAKPVTVSVKEKPNG